LFYWLSPQPTDSFFCDARQLDHSDLHYFARAQVLSFGSPPPWVFGWESTLRKHWSRFSSAFSWWALGLFPRQSKCYLCLEVPLTFLGAHSSQWLHRIRQDCLVKWTWFYWPSLRPADFFFCDAKQPNHQDPGCSVQSPLLWAFESVSLQRDSNLLSFAGIISVIGLFPKLWSCQCLALHFGFDFLWVPFLKALRQKHQH